MEKLTSGPFILGESPVPFEYDVVYALNRYVRYTRDILFLSLSGDRNKVVQDVARRYTD
jgi:hypothetical protein